VVLKDILIDLQGKAVDLEGRLRDKELEVEQLRKALSQAGVKQEVVASPDDHVSALVLTRKAQQGFAAPSFHWSMYCT